MVSELNSRDKLKYMLLSLNVAVNRTPSEMKKPYVGALVLSANKKIVGVGHKTFVDDTAMVIHAERNALEDAIYETEGNTLFTTLEPCVPNLRDGKPRILKSCSELIIFLVQLSLKIKLNF